VFLSNLHVLVWLITPYGGLIPERLFQPVQFLLRLRLESFRFRRAVLALKTLERRAWNRILPKWPPSSRLMDTAGFQHNFQANLHST
jgi:hypothetical protein